MLLGMLCAFVRLGPLGSARWRQFSQPVAEVWTTRLSEVSACLSEVEAAARRGLYAVGWVSAEAAAAFEQVLVPPAPDRFPLLHFSFYRKFQEQSPPQGAAFSVGQWHPEVSRSEYDAAIAHIRRLIAAGETYQTNYTLRLRAPFAGDPLAYFAALTLAQPTDYAAYLDTGRWQVLSASPELFFRRTEQEVITRPMKGTVRRGRTPAEDAKLASWLAQSQKNRAENVMIVDLLRNDLGRVAQFGSVQVSELCRVETYPTLHTMTSTIRAQLRPEVSLNDLFSALFPCGSVTGAPKIRTLGIIRELERSPRRVYCGAVGVIEPGGDATFSVPIRTVLVDAERQEAEYGVGGGITWDSEAADEYEEILTKARFLTGVGQG